MASNSQIEWCDHTDNLWWGCQHAGEGCKNCYAETLANRWAGKSGKLWGADTPRRIVKGVWRDFRKQQAAAEKAGRIDLVFVGSMMDIFEQAKPLIDHEGNPVLTENGMQETTEALRHRFFNEVIPQSPNLFFLLLTKRSSQIKNLIPFHWYEEANRPKNVIMGATVATQKDMATVSKHMKLVSAYFPTFLSVEPMLEAVRFPTSAYIGGSYTPDWVICGGESGHNRRPFKVEWAEDLLSQCQFMRIPFFMKQIDKVQPVPDHLLIREFPRIFQRSTSV